MGHVDKTAIDYISHTMNAQSKQEVIDTQKLEAILRELVAQYRQEKASKQNGPIDFHVLWNPMIIKIIPNIDMFDAKEYRSAIAQYFLLCKLARRVQDTESKDIHVLAGDAGPNHAKVCVNKAVFLTFTTTLQTGKVKKKQLTEGTRILRAQVKGPLSPRIYQEARKKASAAMNKFRE